MKKLSLIGLILLSGCATVQSSHVATPSKSSRGDLKDAATKLGVIVSGEEDASLASGHFGFMNFTFENESDSWITIKKVNIDFEDPILNKEVGFPVGSQIGAWAKAVQEKNAVMASNSAMVFGAIALAGGVTSAVAGDRDVRTAGAIGAVGATTMMTASAISAAANHDKLSRAVPESHLLSGTFDIPPGLHTKKFLLIYTKRPYAIPFVEYMTIHYETSDGKSETVTLPFRRRSFASNWQAFHRGRYVGERGDQLKSASLAQ